jgi:hypothetical protein
VRAATSVWLQYFNNIFVTVDFWHGTNCGQSGFMNFLQQLFCVVSETWLTTSLNFSASVDSFLFSEYFTDENEARQQESCDFLTLEV